MPDLDVPRYTPAELVEELRDNADEIAHDLEGMSIGDMVETQAAQLIEEMTEALTKIAAGAPDAKQIAEYVLSVKAPILPFGGIEDTIARLLRRASRE